MLFRSKLTEFLVKPFLNEDILEEGARDPGIFKAIFLAGGPGSGKSYVASQLFGIPEKINVSKRSEERRVGKECRFRGSPEHEKKKAHE